MQKVHTDSCAHSALSNLLSMGASLMLIGLALVLLAGCSTSVGQTLRSDVDFSLASQPTIYLDNWVRRSAPQVFVAPDRAPAKPPTAVFMPLRLTQKMENANSISHNLSRIVWQTWLGQNALPTLEYADGAPLYRPDVALAYARMRGADLVVGGTISYFVDGGTVGDSAVSLSLEIYDVKSGMLMWSFGQAATMQVGKVSDYLLFATHSRLPADPATACLTTAAADLARLVQAWAYNVQPKKDSWYTPKAF